MIVGFTIIDLKGNREAAIKYIQRVCILDSPDIAENIVDAGSGVNVFSNANNLDDLSLQPFECTPIELKDGYCIVTSVVNFNIEIQYDNETLRLVPTQFIYVENENIHKFLQYKELGLIRIIPDKGSSDSDWILKDGVWDDEGIWVDEEFWRD